MKSILKFLVILLPWFISGLLVDTDTYFYNNLNKPVFAPSSIVFPIVWTVLYLLIAISVYRIYKNNRFKDIPEYNKALLINYFSNQAFSFLFFTVKSPFIAMVDTIIVLISSLFMFEEAKKIDKTSAYLLIPYILWNLFALILITSIYFMNLT